MLGCRFFSRQHSPRKALIVTCRHYAYRLKGFSHKLRYRFDGHSIVLLAREYLIDLFGSYLACSLLQNMAVKLGLL